MYMISDVLKMSSVLYLNIKNVLKAIWQHFMMQIRYADYSYAYYFRTGNLAGDIQSSGQL